MNETICAKCEQVNPSGESFPKITKTPLCPDCTQLVMHYPLPYWLKASLAMTAVLVLTSLVANWRFIDGLWDFRKGMKLISSGEVEKGSQALELAAQEVPESNEFASWSLYFRVVRLVQDEREVEALELIRKAPIQTTSMKGFAELILRVESGVAFETKNYDGFLEKSKAIASQNPNNAVTQAGVASAYACKYAVTGEEEFRKQSLEYLELARALAKQNKKLEAELQEYEPRLLFRIETREIITRKEYMKRFPNGWKKEENPK